jgi:hypothetical protein
MVLFLLEPEVSGGLGDRTIYGSEINILQKGLNGKVKFLHYVFDGWLGDELLESTPCFIITNNLMNGLLAQEFTGFEIQKCEISKSDEFIDLHPDKQLPDFVRLLPLGKICITERKYDSWSNHDFCLSQRGELVVTRRVLDFLKKYSISYCDVTELSPK